MEDFKPDPPPPETNNLEDKERERRARRRLLACCTCCCCCPFLLWVVGVIMCAVIGERVIGRLPESVSDGTLFDVHDVLTYESWPGCEGTAGESYTAWPTFTNCGSECCKCSLVPAFRTYQTQSAFWNITFPSRAGPDGQEVVQLTGLWLPAGPPGGPIVVLCPGRTGDITSIRMQLLSYMLRSTGFSVILVNLRNHGTSGRSSLGKNAWGFDLPYDALGAWDYAVTDPDGVLGGAREASQVGLMGYSLGGFAVASAFGLEHRAAGLWLNDAPSGPLRFYQDLVKRFARIFAVFFAMPAWPLCNRLVGVPIGDNLPADTLPTGPGTQRPVMVVHNPQGKNIRMGSAEDFEDILSGGGRYKVTTQYSWEGKCGTERHAMLPWIVPTEYRRELCNFWSGVFYGRNCTAPDVAFY